MLCVLTAVPYVLFVGLERQEQKKHKLGKSFFIRFWNDSLADMPTRTPYDDDVHQHMGVNRTNTVEHNGENLKPHEVPMMAKYCNSPFKAVTGSEGQAPNGFKLKLVHVFIRHGDRTSIHHIHGYEPEAVDCHFETWYRGQHERFQKFTAHMKQFMGKQPSKSHFRNWAPFPNKKKCGTSDLTNRGALQQLNNGQYFYDKYVNQSDLFDKKISLTSQIGARSTEVSRTYQSAVAFLYGLIPDFNLTHLNIDNSPSQLFCSSKYSLTMSCVCSFGKDLGIRAQKYRSSFNANRAQYKQIRKEVAKIFEINTDQLPWLSAMIDTFSPAICHNFTSPCSVSNSEKCLSGSIYKAMWDEFSEAELAHINDPDQYFLKSSSIMLYPVMVEISHRMKYATEGRYTDKFILFSGHDITLSPLLAILGLHDGHWPPYASRVVIELYEADSKIESNPGRHYIRFIYNGVDKTSSVIFCQGKTFRGMCNFKLFYEFVFREMLHRFGYMSYGDACARRE